MSEVSEVNEAVLEGQTAETGTSNEVSTPQVEHRRGIWLKTPDGRDISRRQLIRELYAGKPAEGDEEAVPGMSRSAIVKHLKEVYGQVVAFQIVFQATQDMGSRPRAPKAEGATATGEAKGPRGRVITFDGKEQLLGDVVSDLAKGNSEEGRPKLSRKGIVKALKDQGVEVAYGTIYGITRKLAAAGVELAPNEPAGSMEPSGSNEPLGDSEAELDLGEGDEDALPE